MRRAIIAAKLKTMYYADILFTLLCWLYMRIRIIRIYNLKVKALFELAITNPVLDFILH